MAYKLPLWGLQLECVKLVSVKLQTQVVSKTSLHTDPLLHGFSNLTTNQNKQEV